MISTANAFVFTESNFGDQIKWKANTNISLYYNSSNSSGLSDSDVYNAMVFSKDSWNSSLNIVGQPISSGAVNTNGKNEIFFSKNSAFFSGVGVVGVTQVSYKEDTGEIVEADIILNDNFMFSSEPDKSNYIGNALTHELGHLLGLGHSQVKRSSMFYKLAIGQHAIDSDDYHGLRKLYGVTDNLGRISGRVIGGKGLYPIFGSHVQLISLLSGEVVAGELTSAAGEFSFSGLSTADQYYIYVEPIKNIVSLHSYYSSVRKNYCQSFSDYRGSFYTSCESSKKGIPTAISFSTSSNVNLGNITIRCGLDVPSNYLAAKESTYEIISDSTKFSHAHVGYFSKKDVDNFKVDHIEIDLTAMVIPSALYYLQINVISQQIFSPLKVKLTAERNSNFYDYDFDPAVENKFFDGTPNLDLSKRIPLSTISLDNKVLITIEPSSGVQYAQDSGDYLIDDLYPSSNEYLDSNYFYLFTAHLVKYDPITAQYSNVLIPTQEMRDNSSCPEALATYTTSPYTTTKNFIPDTVKAGKSEGNLIGCGSIAFENSGGPPSGANKAVGYILGLLPIVLLARKRFRLY